MDAFEYLAGLLTIILGLSIARTMSGIGAFLLLEKRTLRNWNAGGFCLVLAMLQIGWWRVLWAVFNDVEFLSIAQVYAWVAATVMLYLSSYVLVQSTSTSTDYAVAQSGKLHPVFFTSLALHFSAVPIESAIRGVFSVTVVGFPLLMIALCLLGMFLKGEKALAVLMVSWNVLMFSVFLVDPAGAFLPSL